MAAKPHLLVFPYPAQGHLIPLMDLSTHLATHFSFTITIIITPKNLPLIHPYLSTTPKIQPLILPLPTSPSSSLPSGAEHVRHLPPGFSSAALIRPLSLLHPSIFNWAQTQSNPPTALISDFFLGWCRHLAADLQIPHLPFFSSGALLVSLLHSLFISPSPISLSPSLPSFPFHHLPSIFRRYIPADPEWEFTRRSLLSNSLSSAAILNTFHSLESPYLSHLLSSSFSSSRLFAIAPIPPSTIPPNPNNDSKILSYLNSCPPNSVVYICFGSQFTPDSSISTAIRSALEISGVRFVWAMAPEEFEGKGMAVRGWVEQREVLGHVAVGAFVSHCGWNSVMEGMVAGVMVLAWPMEADQFVNARLMVEEMGVAVRVCDGKVPEVEELGRMIGDSVVEGSWPEVRVRVREMQTRVQEAVEEGGSSYVDMKKMVEFLRKC